MNGREAVASTADSAFAVDPKGRIIAWNDAATTTFGWSAKEAKGKHCWELLQGRDVFGNRYCSETCPMRDMAVRGQPVHAYQVHFQNALGNRVHAEVSILVVSGSTRHDIEIVHIVRHPSLVERHPAAREPSLASNNRHARLSERQLEVLTLLAEGQSTKTIAETLCIKSSTVRHHVQEILTRLKVHTRLEAVVLAQRIGLV